MKAGTKTFVVAKHTSEGKLILAVCDSDVYGKKFDGGGMVLDLGSKFYSGDESAGSDVMN